MKKYLVEFIGTFFLVFTVGMTVFKPTADRMAGMIAADGVTPQVLGLGQRVLRFARLDYSVMLVIVADMVLKPTAQDAFVLGGMATVLAAGIAMALGLVGSRRLTPAAAV